jgi:hypothetical protein
MSEEPGLYEQAGSEAESFVCGGEETASCPGKKTNNVTYRTLQRCKIVFKEAPLVQCSAVQCSAGEAVLCCVGAM